MLRIGVGIHKTPLGNKSFTHYNIMSVLDVVTKDKYCRYDGY
jgi:hypothetical protein